MNIASYVIWVKMLIAQYYILNRKENVTGDLNKGLKTKGKRQRTNG